MPVTHPFPEQPLAPPQAYGNTLKFDINGREYFLGLWEMLAVGPTVCLVTFNANADDKWRFVWQHKPHKVNPNELTGEGLDMFIKTIIKELTAWFQKQVMTETGTEGKPIPAEYRELYERLQGITLGPDGFRI